MDKTFNISVKNKRAKNLTNMRYVCDNNDYVAAFDFDDDWNDYPIKTVRFVEANGEHVDVNMDGNTCLIPRFRDTFRIEVGVYAGDIRTTTAAIIEAERSITSKSGDKPEVPEPDRYDEMMEAINADALRAENAANEAEEAAEKAVGSGIMVVHKTSGKEVNKTYAEMMEAVNGGKTLLMVDTNGMVYVCTYADPNQVLFTAHSSKKYNSLDGLQEMTISVSRDNVVTSGISPAKAQNFHKLKLTGAVNAEYDGSEEVTVRIPQGGGGGGEQNAQAVKQITGRFTTGIIDHPIEFDMPVADIVALGEEIKDYRIVFYRSTQYDFSSYLVKDIDFDTGLGRLVLTAYDVAMSGSDRALFVMIDRNDYTVTYEVESRQYYEMPGPTGNDLYLGTNGSGKYVLKPKPEPDPVMLYALDTDGVLTFVYIDTFEPYMITVAELMGLLGYKGFVLTLGVVNTSGEGSAYTVSSFSTSGDMYILFGNHEGRAIRMSADGTLAYVDKGEGTTSLVDSVTGKNYVLTVTDGKLTMEEAINYADKKQSSISLVDSVTNKTYKVTVADGKLTMEEVM